ncbi:MAG: low molecular weight phosphotyrosine protein phosphatase [Deltaproteobacteria bacterium]|nr:low molecular weight phosphotyrosine protein phosphatase [Deltaproteobacteria bacterium]
MRVLFICSGNICRSPTAEGVLRHLAHAASLELEVDSAGIGGWHAGDPPDPRTVRYARARGYDLSSLRARQVAPADFAFFDRIYAMDQGHLRDLHHLAPELHRAKVSLFLDVVARDLDDAALGREVPDPYYGGAEGFEHVLDLVEEGCRAIVAELVARR